MTARLLRILVAGLLVAASFGVCQPACAETAKTLDVASPSDQPSAGSLASASTEKDANASDSTTVISRRAMLISSLTIFVLAIFVGFEVVTKVPPTLHTPLMSGSNAISGVTVIGALLLAGAIDSGQPGSAASLLAKIMAFIAVIFATINVVGGFLVTHRMLRMFKR